MAAVDDSDPGGGKRLVLRVKRKRTEDHVEALVVSHVPSKKAKEKSEDSGAVDHVFTFLGTFGEGDSLTSQHLLKKLNSKPISHDNVKKKQESNLEGRLNKLRQEKKASHQDARFKLLSKNRPDQDADGSAPANGIVVKEEESSESTDAADDEVKQLFKVYDVIRDEQISNQRSSSSNNRSEDPNAILCNSVKMIREKLTVDKDSNPGAGIGEKGYVYDYYYADDYSKDLLGDVVEITGINDDDLFLETVDREFDEMFEDDDSNDENNWRNDYPDEGEWSSEEEQQTKRLPDPDFGFDIDDDDQKYHKKAFGEDLSSEDDDELDFYGKPCNLNACPKSEVFHEELSPSDEGF